MPLSGSQIIRAVVIFDGMNRRNPTAYLNCRENLDSDTKVIDVAIWRLRSKINYYLQENRDLWFASLGRCLNYAKSNCGVRQQELAEQGSICAQVGYQLYDIATAKQAAYINSEKLDVAIAYLFYIFM